MQANEQPQNEAEVSRRGAWHGALVGMRVTVHAHLRSSAALLLQRRCCCTAALMRCCSEHSGSHRGLASARHGRAHCNSDPVVPYLCRRDRFNVRAGSSSICSFITERLLLFGNMYTCAFEHCTPARVTITALCNLTPSVRTRSCNYVCGCRVQHRHSETCTSDAALLLRSQAAWSGQVPCYLAAHLCGALQPATTASAHPMRACTSGRDASDRRTGRGTSHASAGAEHSVLKRRLAAERRSRRGHRAGGSARVERSASHCRHRRTCRAAAIAAPRLAAIDSACGGARRGGSQQSWEGRGRVGRIGMRWCQCVRTVYQLSAELHCN